MSGFALGDRVEVSRLIYRQRSGNSRKWVAAGSWATGVGVIVGKRTLSNGEVEVIREGDGYGGSVAVMHQYRPTEHFEAYLVAFDLRQKPILAMAEHVTAVER